MIDAFVHAATNGRRTRAEALLAGRPEIARDPWAALVLGRDWPGDPNAPGGPRGWPPLTYVCHSVFGSPALARQLLARGADPDARDALYGAAGVVHDPELTRLLLEAGAQPDDNESLYHSTEAEDPACLRLLLAHGATVPGTNAVAHALDDERPEHLRLLLEGGADPNEGALVAHAVRRGRGPATIRLLAAHGADPERPGGETWRGDVPLRTPYQHAVIRNRDDVAAVLAELGADTATAPADRALAALARGAPSEAELPEPLDPDAQEVLILAALRGHADAVLAVVGPSFAGVVGGSPAGTLLHHAAWVGDAGLVTWLLERGLDPDAPSDAEYDTPLAWAALASAGGEGDHAGVAAALTAAGAHVQARLLDVAEGPLYEWLTRRRMRA
jgi:ankyrin repeat protein